jgi:hypothetical protein
MVAGQSAPIAVQLPSSAAVAGQPLPSAMVAGQLAPIVGQSPSLAVQWPGSHRFKQGDICKIVHGNEICDVLQFMHKYECESVNDNYVV